MENWFVVLVPVWLFGLIFPPTMEFDDKQVLQFVSLVWPIPLYLFSARSRFLYGEIHRIVPSIRVWTLLFIAAITASALLSVDPLRSLGYAVVTSIGLMCGAGLWSCINRRMRSGLAAYAIIGSLFSIYIYFEGTFVQGRRSFGATGHPNYLGLICFGILVCCLAIRNVAARFLLITINLILIIDTQARSCLLASVISMTVHFLVTQTNRNHRPRSAMVTLSSLLVVGTTVSIIFAEEINNKVSELMFLNDKYRGVGTGFTGRVDAWQEAYQMFLANPFFGIGFRTHEQYMTTLPSAHNGYLSMLADTGACGTVCILTLIGVCSWRLFKIARTGNQTAIVGFAFVTGYLCVAMFERFLVNFGSPTSMLMWIFLFMCPTSKRIDAANYWTIRDPLLDRHLVDRENPAVY